MRKVYSVEIEHLDKDGNVWDSQCVLETDSYFDAMSVAEGLSVGENERLAIWERDDNDCVVDSYEF